jgi:hypothetical protein
MLLLALGGVGMALVIGAVGAGVVLGRKLQRKPIPETARDTNEESE